MTATIQPGKSGSAPAATQPASTTKTEVDLTDANTASQPKLPHERDGSVGSTGGVRNKTVQQAHRDVQRGLQDTSRAPEADAAYDKLKRK